MLDVLTRLALDPRRASAYQNGMAKTRTQKPKADSKAPTRRGPKASQKPPTNCIRELREARGMTLEELATLVGTTEAQLSRLETGERQLTEVWMRRIAPRLGVEPADLLEIAAFIDIQDEVEPADKGMSPALSGALNSRDLAFLRLSTNQLEAAGYAKGKEVVFLCDEEAVKSIKTGDVVLVRLTRKSDNTSVRIVRQFVAPSTLITNRKGRNVAIDLDERRFSVEIMGLAMPDN